MQAAVSRLLHLACQPGPVGTPSTSCLLYSPCKGHWPGIPSGPWSRCHPGRHGGHQAGPAAAQLRLAGRSSSCCLRSLLRGCLQLATRSALLSATQLLCRMDSPSVCLQSLGHVCGTLWHDAGQCALAYGGAT